MKHLYIVGSTGIGKSYLANLLRDTIRVYDIPHESWNDMYCDGTYDLMIMDEFNGQKTITEMNLLTDGYPTPLKRRSSPPYTKRDKLPVIILSNKAPEEVYHKAEKALVEAFTSRYEVCRIYHKIEVNIECEEERTSDVPKGPGASEPIVLWSDSDEEIIKDLNKKEYIEIPDDVFETLYE